MTTALVTLTVAEREFLDDCEATISRGLMTFVEVGQALIDIRDNRLYRATHAAFEDYCVDRWGFTFQHAGRLIDAATITQLISTPIGVEINNEPPVDAVPANEAQARPLAKLLPHPMAEPEDKAAAEEKIRETWNEAVETAPRDAEGKPKVTAKHVETTLTRREAAKETGAPPDAPPPATTKPDRKQNRRPITDAFRDGAYDLTKTVERLERLADDDRFPRNAEQVARVVRGDLLRAVDLLASVIDRIPNLTKEPTE